MDDLTGRQGRRRCWHGFDPERARAFPTLPAVDLGDYLERQAPLGIALSVSMPAALYEG